MKFQIENQKAQLPFRFCVEAQNFCQQLKNFYDAFRHASRESVQLISVMSPIFMLNEQSKSTYK